MSHFSCEMERSKAKTLVYNEVNCPIFKKKKILNLAEKSTFQLSEKTMRSKNKSNILIFSAAKRTHATTLEETFIPLFFKYIQFLVKRVVETST